MNSDERDIITRFIERVSGSSAVSGSVPGTHAALPAVDREADLLIGDLFNRYPDARYRLTQTAFVQEHALVEAQSRIARLEADLAAARQAGSAQPQQQSRGFFGGLFGGGQPQAQQYQPQPMGQPQYQQPAYQPQYAPPGYQPGLLQRSGGSGFLGSALTTAAGVAGGMVAGNALMGLFSGGEHHGGGFGGGGEGGGSPWGGAAAGGGWDNQASSADPGTGSAGWDNVVNQPDQGGGFDTASSGWDSQGGGDGGGGFDDTSSS